MAVGVSRDKPVGFLVLGTFGAMAVSLIAFARTVRRTGAGDQVVSNLRSRHADLKSRKPKFTEAHSDVGFALPMGVALFGTALRGYSLS